MTLLAVGPATAAVAQPTPTPTPSLSPAVSAAPVAEPTITSEPVIEDPADTDGDAPTSSGTGPADKPAKADKPATTDESATSDDAGNPNDPAAATAPTSAPTIVSDLEDYAPGSTVTLTGAGWLAAETVSVFVEDTATYSWELERTVTANSAGELLLTFQLPNRYIPHFGVTASGEHSGIATTTFTDAPVASGDWQYWIARTTPGGGQTVSGTQTVTYTLSTQQITRFFNFNAVTGAVVTFELEGDVSSISVSGTGGNNGAVTLNGNTVTWQGMNLSRGLSGADTRTITVTATIAAGASGGTLNATMSPTGDDNGSFWSGTGRAENVTHTIAGPTVGDCSFATPGSGAFAQSICWFDLEDYNPAQAATTAGQQMQQVLPNGYRLSYTVKTTGSNGSGTTNVAAVTLPTWTGGFLGNPDPSFQNNYQGIAGSPALYQSVDGQTTTIALSDIVLRTASGDRVTGFALVGADAESSDGGEQIRWNSDKPFTSIGPLGNACGGGFTGNGTTQVTCVGSSSGTKTGTAIVYAEDPEQFSQTMVGSGLQGVAFGVMVSGVQVTKQIVNKVSASDAFTITAEHGGDDLGSATTDPSGFADTGQIHMIASGNNSEVVLSEVPVAGTDAANYVASWSCTKNNELYEPSGTDTSKTVEVAFGDFVNCAITNTGPSLTLSKTVDNTAGGALTPGAWTLRAANGANSAVVNEAPTQSATQTGSQATASTTTVSLPRGNYTLSELSTAVGHEFYVPGQWECSTDTQGVPVSNDVVTIAAGAEVACGITNTYLPTANVTISKVALDTAGAELADASGWELGASIATGSSAGLSITPGTAQTTVANGSVPQPWTVQFVNEAQTANIAVSEVQQDGYALVEVACTVTPVTGSATTMTFTDTTSAIIPDVQAGDQVNCVITNQQLSGSVTWSKVRDDAEGTELAGSEWNLSGSGVPANTVVLDCITGPCLSTPLTDQQATAGHFELDNLAWGEYTLTESKAPAGYRLDATTVHTFTISASSLTASLGPVVNEQLAVPELPLTGGLSTDLFLALGTGLMAAAGIGALMYRRRSSAAFSH